MTQLRVCPECNAEDAPAWVCPFCALRSGLSLLAGLGTAVVTTAAVGLVVWLRDGTRGNVGFLTRVLLLTSLSNVAIAGQTPPSSPRQEPRGFYPSARIATDYRFQGISLSDRKPVPQLSLHWLLPERFYAGVWMSRVDFNDPSDTWLEIDIYAGRRISVRETELRVEAMYNSFNEGDARWTYDFFQAKVLLDRDFGRLALGTSGALSPSGSYGSGVTWHMQARADFELTPVFSVSASAGGGLVEHRTNRTYWGIGVTTKLRNMSLDVRYADTSLSFAECGFVDWCEPAIVTTLSFPAY